MTPINPDPHQWVTDLLFKSIDELFQTAFVIFFAPIFLGWINMWRSWLQNRKSAGILQPYRDLFKSLGKEAVVATGASPLFRMTPYIVFGSMGLAAALVPAVTTDLPFGPAADAIALVGVFSLARIFMALSAMDIGTPFGDLGARREMMIAFLAEPATMMILFTASLISRSTSLSTIAETLGSRHFTLYPSLVFATTSFFLIILAENSRLPIDNPSTHLELTMIHEAMLLEYSGRHLALMEWGSSIKLLVYFSIIISFFLPWGISHGASFQGLLAGFAYLILKLSILAPLLAILEATLAKLRLFRAPEFLAAAYLLAVIAFLSHFILEV